jgi:hypothetical protein
MIVEIRASISEKGRTTSYVSGKAIYEDGKIEKIYVNSSSFGQEEKDKIYAKELIESLCDKTLQKIGENNRV